jgi:hypothetical protein
MMKKYFLPLVIQFCNMPTLGLGIHVIASHLDRDATHGVRLRRAHDLHVPIRRTVQGEWLYHALMGSNHRPVEVCRPCARPSPWLCRPTSNALLPAWLRGVLAFTAARFQVQLHSLAAQLCGDACPATRQ